MRSRPAVRAVIVAAVVVVLFTAGAIWRSSSDTAWMIIFAVVCLGAAGMFVLYNASGQRDGDERDQRPDEP